MTNSGRLDGFLNSPEEGEGHMSKLTPSTHGSQPLLDNLLIGGHVHSSFKRRGTGVGVRLRPVELNTIGLSHVAGLCQTLHPCASLGRRFNAHCH